jgi:hypothetical protein
MNISFFAKSIDDQSNITNPKSRKQTPMKTDQYPDPAPTVFPRSLTDTVSKLKNRLQRQYERTYPELGDLVRIVLDEEEAKAWELSFPHLFLPDLVEHHITQLGLRPANIREDHVAAPAGFSADQYQLVPAYADR